MIDVLIVGGGPSGLTLALLLLEAGHSVKVLESRAGVSAHSRAIGIHPPGLEVLDRVGVGASLAKQGVHIGHGLGISRNRIVAELDFGFLPVAHPFVLALPQDQTVIRLRERLTESDPTAFLGGVEFRGFTSHPGYRHVQVAGADDRPGSFDCRFLIGADGSRSAVRREAMIPFKGRQLPDHYLMGDYPESTNFGSVAALFLHPEGIVESFPLPFGLRRWVAWIRDGESADLSAIVARRTGFVADRLANSMYSRFLTANRFVDRMDHGGMLLIGDAAHEVSPIGGQGMTLGLLDALALAPLLSRGLSATTSQMETEIIFASWSGVRLKAAQRAARQAHLNMRLGRPLDKRLVGSRDALVRGLLASKRFERAVASTFTMVNNEVRR